MVVALWIRTQEVASLQGVEEGPPTSPWQVAYLPEWFRECKEYSIACVKIHYCDISHTAIHYLTCTSEIMLQIVGHFVLSHPIFSEGECQWLEGRERVFGRGSFEPLTQQISKTVDRFPHILFCDNVQRVRVEPESHTDFSPFSCGLSHEAQQWVQVLLSQRCKVNRT